MVGGVWLWGELVTGGDRWLVVVTGGGWWWLVVGGGGRRWLTVVICGVRSWQVGW